MTGESRQFKNKETVEIKRKLSLFFSHALFKSSDLYAQAAAAPE
jgi:hypothetical protein